MFTVKRDVKENLLEHSEAKVRLVGEYLKRYLGVIANLAYIEKIRVYDLFCGKGRYDNGGEGSPLIITRAIDELYKSGLIRGAFPKIDCHFNDIQEEKVANTKLEIEKLKLDPDAFGEIHFSSEDYQEMVKRLTNLLPRLKNEKVFIFIDPYEYKHIKLRDIRELLKSKNTELLLWLPTAQMYRFHQNGTPEALKDFIDELVAYKDWREKDSDTPWKFIGHLKDSFRAALGGDFYVDTFSIEKDPRTVFCMYFFTSHIYGAQKMLEAKWEIDQEQGKGWAFDAQPTLFSAQKANPLADKFEEFLKTSRTNAAVYDFVIHNGFLTTHATEVLVAWQEQGKIEVIESDGKSARKRSFYISYEKYRDEPNKVKIKKK